MAPHRRAQIEDEVLTLINQPQFADVFGEHSRAEVPIMGEVDGKIISAQIDRLVELDDKMLIIDFKTNRPAAKTLATTPPSYIKQLQIYAELVRRIYPQKSVEAYILWTNEARLMRIL
jgi:ATP-dependent helicase/nuclease subunit A